MIEKLTPEQEALIPAYLEKWRSIGILTKPIDRQKATEAVKNIYIAIGKQPPKIVFCDSPYAAANALLKKRRTKLKRNKTGSRLDSQLDKQLVVIAWRKLEKQLSEQLRHQLINQLVSPMTSQIFRQLENQLHAQLNHRFYYFLQPERLSCIGVLFDWCISVLNCYYNPTEWLAFQGLVAECGWILPYQNICFVCDRPRILSFDSQNLLHGEGQPAIQFADGFSVYCHHGVLLPEQYGKVHPNEWRSQWLLEEQNAELKRVLIQRIGYARICRELQAIELDNWQEYTLLKINADVDEEPMYLLKMTCPSTGHIHALRVPPDMTSAREAIRWVNWGIDPEEFSVQT